MTLALFIYWSTLRRKINRFFLVRRFPRHAMADAEVEIRIDEQGFSGGTAASRGEFTWEAVTKVVSERRGYLVYQYPLFYWLPATAFPSPEEKAWFEKTARARAREYVVCA